MIAKGEGSCGKKKKKKKAIALSGQASLVGMSGFLPCSFCLVSGKEAKYDGNIK